MQIGVSGEYHPAEFKSQFWNGVKLQERQLG